MAHDFNPKLGRHKSSALVDSVEPPEYWTEVDASHYLAAADAYLARLEVKSHLDMHCAPSLEPTFRVRREADVVAYAATHLTHAVNMALGGPIFPGKVEMVSELEEGGCRPDCIWRAAGSNNGEHTFAALEMKITGAINPDAIARARMTDAEAAEKMKQPPPSTNAPSLFKAMDAKVYSTMKQMTTYAHSEVFDTRYVASFDGKHLFLGVFSQGPKGNSVPLLKATMLPCHGDQGHHARKALLGWLIEAKVEKGKGGNHCIPRVLRQFPERGLAHRVKKES